MKLLHVLAPGEVGGLDRVVETLATGSRARGHQVHVAAVVDRVAELPMFSPLRAAGVAVHQVPVRPHAFGIERSGIEALCRQITPDLVHTHGYRADVVDAPAARELGIPTVTTVHGFAGGGWKTRAYQLLQRMALRHFDLVVAVARPQAEQLARSGVSSERLRLVPNAWCPDQAPLDRDFARRMLGVPPGRFHIGWVGRLSWEKGPDVFLDAIARLRDLPLAVSMIGDGPDLHALEARASRLGIRSLVTWWGKVPHASGLFPGFDAFVLSSRTEGTPMVLFEAMRSAVPVVATAVGGIPDVVSSNEAILVSPRDPVALARGIHAINDHPEAAATRSARALARLCDYDSSPWLDRYDVLYQSVKARSPLAAAGV
jgi:glycosyltransferase involved in cell wall biosynthesis